MAAGAAIVYSGKDVNIAGVDYSAAATNAKITQTFTVAEAEPSFGEDSVKRVNTGKYSTLFEATLRLDGFGANTLNAAIAAALASATAPGEIAIKLKGTSAAISATNPSYEMTAIVNEFVPFGDDGSPTAVAMISVSWAGTGDLVVDITP